MYVCMYVCVYVYVHVCVCDACCGIILCFLGMGVVQEKIRNIRICPTDPLLN